MTTLTYDNLKESIDKLRIPLYYGTSDVITRGDFYHCKETEITPEYIICHPDDLDTLRTAFPTRLLVHLSEEPPEYAMERLRRNTKFGLS